MTEPAQAPRRRASPWLAPAGYAIGLVAAMCGIGGGLFAVPLLHFGFHVPLRRAVATSLVLVLATASSATLTEVLRPDSAVHLAVALPLAIGSLAGAQLGFMVSKRIDTVLLRRIFVVALLLAGARILFGGGAPDAAAGMESGTFQSALVLLIGVAGGIVAPIIGIGGGLVFVPSLYLALPAIGFEGARACSLAAAVVTASRSLWLYGREGSIERASGLWLAVGALSGAASGVFLFHQPGWVDLARRGLGLVLWIVSARFALDLWRRRRAEARA